jgi:hypothetical protein
VETEVLVGNPVQAPLCPPQIPHYLTWDRTRTAAKGSKRLIKNHKVRQKHDIQNQEFPSMKSRLLIGSMLADRGTVGGGEKGISN